MTVIFGSQANTYSGGTLINGGVVVMNNSASLGTGAITNNGGILRLFPHAARPYNYFVISNTCVIDDAYYAGNRH